MTFAKTKAGKIYYEISGKGSAVVLIRGLGCFAHHWLDWDKNLAKNHRVIIFDHRGIGQSTLPVRPWHSMKDLAQDIMTLLRAERIEKAHIAGTSLGGMIALQFGLSHPEATLSITAINASVGGSGRLRLTSKALEFLARAAVEGKPSYEGLAKLLTATTSSEETRAKITRDWQAVDARNPNPRTAVACQLAIAGRWQPWRQFSRLQVPVHIICGADDSFVARGNSLFLAEKIPGALLTTIENAGHEPHLDQPEELFRVMEEFYEKI